MRRSAFLGVLVAAGAALSACDIPAATFDAITSASSNPTTGGAGSTTANGGDTTGPMHTTGSGATGGTTSSTGGSGTGTMGGTGGVGGTGGTGGTGGLGGAGGVFMGPVVPCGSSGKDCKPYEVCCHSPVDAVFDKCSSGCDTSTYGALKCNGPEDCPGGKCCLTVSEFLGQTFHDSECKASCDSGQKLMCNLSMPVCTAPKTCTTMESGYPGYGDCE